MPRLMKFEIEVRTGRIGTSCPVQFSVNGHLVQFADLVGGTAPGEVFHATFAPMSYIHQLALHGPADGQWELDQITVHFSCEYAAPYAVRWEGAMLDATTAANLWAPPAAPSFDV